MGFIFVSDIFIFNLQIMTFFTPYEMVRNQIIRNDIPDILGISDIWISSTLFEGQSNSLLEAMAMKKPIITTNISENSEVVRHKKEALLVPIKSPRKMANAIMVLIENKQFAENLATNAYQRVYQNFNINKVIIKLLKFYDLLMTR